jgi:hypothetical protein
LQWAQKGGDGDQGFCSRSRSLRAACHSTGSFGCGLVGWSMVILLV